MPRSIAGGQFKSIAAAPPYPWPEVPNPACRWSGNHGDGHVAPALIRFRAMAAVADLERLLERVFERTTARLFGAGIQVVQLERRVERAMERARSQDGTRVSVPARYRVRLRPSDLDDVAARADGAPAVAVRLAESALTFARSHGYHLDGRPEIWLVADPAVDRGQVEVDVVGKETLVPGVSLPAPASADAWPPASGPPASGPPASPPYASTSTPAAILAPSVVTDQASGGEPLAAGIRGDGSQTLVFRRPVPRAARAVLRICAADGGERTVEVDGSPLTIGRSRDNGLVLGDARVSRHHGRLQARHGTLVYTDLGSTNGSRVNGIRVDEIVLGEGDRLQVGDTVLVVETLPG